jgi:hypothetical protein
MNRLAIRNYVRFLIQELTELPEGFFKDSDTDVFNVNDAINIAQQKVAMDLTDIIPEEFRKSFLISVDANEDEYHIEDDLSVTDFYKMEDIYHNYTGKKPHGLLYVEHDQLHEFDPSIGTPGEPKCWYWPERGVIGFRPIPATTVANRYKAFYFYELPELNQDSTHDPDTDKYAIPPFPVVAHKLISIDAVIQLQIADESGALEVMKLYDVEFKKVARFLGQRPSMRVDRRLSLNEAIR